MDNTNTTSPEKFRMLCELRAELEIFAVRQICKKNDRSWVEAQFNPILKRLLKATKEQDYTSFMAEDRILHKTIIKLADLPALESAWETVWEPLAQFHRESFSQYWPDLRILMREHEYLINTICSCDLSAAEDGVRNHLQAIWFRIAQKEDETQLQTNPLSRAVAYISFNLQHPLLLKQIAGEVAFTSAGHLSKLFRDRYGKSFQSYVQEMRLDKAATLLQQTDLPISTIAHRVGYQDISRFGQHFKRRFEKTPNKWRQHFKNNPTETGTPAN